MQKTGNPLLKSKTTKHEFHARLPFTSSTSPLIFEEKHA
jgi:hypothetical protein